MPTRFLAGLVLIVGAAACGDGTSAVAGGGAGGGAPGGGALGAGGLGGTGAGGSNLGGAAEGGGGAATLPVGAPCSLAAQCGSGFCTDGVCCDAACDGVCGSCLAAETGATDGVCSPIAEGTPCGAAVCAADVLQPAPLCSAQGACVAHAPADCGLCSVCASTGDACELLPAGSLGGCSVIAPCNGMGACAGKETVIDEDAYFDDPDSNLSCAQAPTMTFGLNDAGATTDVVVRVPATGCAFNPNGFLVVSLPSGMSFSTASAPNFPTAQVRSRIGLDALNNTVLVLSTSASTLSFPNGAVAANSAGSNDEVVVELLPTGQVVWSFALGDGATGDPPLEVQELDVSEDGHVLLAGVLTRDFNFGDGLRSGTDRDAFVAEYDGNTLLFSARLVAPGAQDVVAAHRLTNGELALAIQTDGAIDLGAGPIAAQRTFLARLDGSDGAVLSSIELPEPAWSALERIAFDDAGEALVETNASIDWGSGAVGPWSVTKLDNLGQPLWSKAFSDRLVSDLGSNGVVSIASEWVDDYGAGPLPLLNTPGGASYAVDGSYRFAARSPGAPGVSVVIATRVANDGSVFFVRRTTSNLSMNPVSLIKLSP